MLIHDVRRYDGDEIMEQSKLSARGAVSVLLLAVVMQLLAYAGRAGKSKTFDFGTF